MTKRINWSEIYIFYISSDIITLRDCAEKFEVSYDVVRQKASEEKWRQKKKETRQVAIQIVEQETSTKIAQINKKHIQLAQALQVGGAKAISEGALPTNARDIQAWISAGISIEKKAWGIDQPAQQKIEPTEQKNNKYILEDKTPGIKTNDTAI